MTSSVMTQTTPSTGSPRYLWAAVGVLGVASLAMGAALLRETRTPPEQTPVAAVQAPAPQLALNTPQEPVEPDKTNKIKQKEPAARISHVQTAPKTVAKTQTEEILSTQKSVSTNLPELASVDLPAQKVLPQAPRSVCSNCAVVETVTPVQREAAASGAGAVAGAVLGGLVGNQFGGGDGKTVATIIGLMGGGWAGNTVEKRMKTQTVYQVVVRMEDGSRRTIEQATPASVGARVTVDGNAIAPASGTDMRGGGQNDL